MKKTHQWMLFFLFLFFLSTLTACTKKAEKIVFYQTREMTLQENTEGEEPTVLQKMDAIEIKDSAVRTDETSASAIETNPTQSTLQTIAVYLCGEVINPGVYLLEAGSRLYQAVEMAGGLTDQAQAEAVNLARVLSDSEQIYIPNVSENISISVMENSQSVFTKASNDFDASDSTVSDPIDNSTVININQASVEQLMQLPGIGQVKAEAIVAYRESNGLFTSIEEIKNVPGIKEAAFEKIKGMIIV